MTENQVAPRSVLTVAQHDRDAVGMRYVYPVVSRRAGGVSIGVNLNPNNACNFRCIYCQVPGLVAGNAPEIDLAQLRSELGSLLQDILCGSFMEERVPQDMRRLNDLAFSGNGEPTTCRNFDEVVQAVLAELDRFDLPADFKRIVITNGSCTDRPHVERGLKLLSRQRSEVWFKLDAATPAGARRINSSSASVEERLLRLRRVANICPTWIQTCMFLLDGLPPPPEELDAYELMLRALQADAVPFRGVLLYGLARESYQPEAPRLQALSPDWLEAFAQRIRSLGVKVRVSP